MLVPFVCGPDDLQLREVAAPRPGPRDVVLRVAFTGICGSDLAYVAQGGLDGPGRSPFPLGHELSGTVVEAGPEVTSVSPGDRVVVNPLVNMIGNGGPEGGFAEHLLVRDLVGRPGSLLRLPDGVSLETGALAEPLAVAAHAINRLGAGPGDKVAIFGAGPIGLAAMAVLRWRGVDDVAVFDPSPFRRDRARRLGAAHLFDPLEAAPADSLRAAHGAVPVFRVELPATSHYLEASGAPIVPEIVEHARAGAAICVVSLQKKPAAIDLRRLMSKELILTGALGYPTEFAEVLDVLGSGAVDLADLVSHRFDPAELPAAFETARRPDRAAKVLVRYGGA